MFTSTMNNDNSPSPNDLTPSDPLGYLEDDEKYNCLCDIELNTRNIAEHTAQLVNIFGPIQIQQGNLKVRDTSKSRQLATPPEDDSTIKGKVADNRFATPTRLTDLSSTLTQEPRNNSTPANKEGLVVHGSDLVKGDMRAFKIWDDSSKEGGLNFDSMLEAKIPKDWKDSPQISNKIKITKPSTEIPKREGDEVTILKHTDVLLSSGSYQFRAFWVRWMKPNETEKTEELMLQKDVENLKNQNRDIYIQTDKMPRRQLVCAGAKKGAIGPMISKVIP